MMKVIRSFRGGSLTGRMIRVILLFWVLPFIVLSGITMRVYTQRNEKQVISTAITAAGGAGTVTSETARTLVELSRQATYDGVIKQSYETFLKTGDEASNYRDVYAYLGETYRFSKLVSNTILLYTDPMQYEYYTYSNVAGATYANVEEFKRNTAEAVRSVAKDLDTKTKFVYLNDHLYVVRNIVRSNYEPFATLVMEVNMDRLFAAMDNHLIWEEHGIAMLNGEVIWKSGGLQEEDAESMHARLHEQLSGSELIDKQLGSSTDSEVEYNRKNNILLLAVRTNDQTMHLAFTLDTGTMFSDRSVFWAMYIVFFITLIPLVIATFSFFYTNINRPINALVEVSREIEEGNYGVQAVPFDDNAEIKQLVDTFNHLSVSLEESFKRIYAEQVAERDATLKALQAQINPHFLNNTLEIINWKARMSGMNDVSGMIEALSVMMNATLNRNNENFISLGEEMQYVEAYVYIIRQRFGDRFTFSSEVDETLLSLKVPRLILQPLVENAVDHGGDKYGHLNARLRIWEEEEIVGAAEEADHEQQRDAQKDVHKDVHKSAHKDAHSEVHAEPHRERKVLYMVVENNGEMTESDRKKVSKLLAEVDQKSVGSLLSQEKTEGLDRQSIGIRNVHLRLRLLYGQGSGLTIDNDGEGTTTSTLRIETERNVQQNER